MSAFQTFERPQLGSGGRSRAVPPTISVGKPGLLSFNRPATELFGPAESWFWVCLLADPVTGRIAVKAVDEHDPNGWKPRARPGGSVVINARAFIRHLGVEPGTRWLAARDGDLIVGVPS